MITNNQNTFRHLMRGAEECKILDRPMPKHRGESKIGNITHPKAREGMRFGLDDLLKRLRPTGEHRGRMREWEINPSRRFRRVLCVPSVRFAFDCVECLKMKAPTLSKRLRKHRFGSLQITRHSPRPIRCNTASA